MYIFFKVQEAGQELNKINRATQCSKVGKQIKKQRDNDQF